MTAGRAKSERLRLLADIGGTNARFALQKPGRKPVRYRVLKTADHAGPAEAVAQYLSAFGNFPRPTAAALAIAGPVTGDRIRLTNSKWAFSVRALKRKAGLEHLWLLNDFEALAWSLDVLKPADLEKMGGKRAAAGAPRAVFGPGTGLGVSCLLPDNPDKPGGPRALATEGGHASAAAGNPREDAVIARLHERFNHVSVERMLSGPGLANIYRALAEVDGETRKTWPSPDRVTALALDGKDARARETVRMFAAMTGSFAGDLALLYGARGGVYVGGGVIGHLGKAFDRRLFRRRFEAKGRFRGWLADIPAYLIRHPSPAMLGLGRFLDLSDT